MKPSETKDESMQRADTQSPLRCSPPASSKAQPDHRRKVVQKVGSQRHSQWHPVSRQRENEFFFLNAAWLNEGRCPGGRPSVSVNK